MITLLDTGSIIAPLSQQTATASHHRACLILDEYDNEVCAHIKAFPHDSHGLANELAGWMLHRGAGIETAPKIWVIILTSEELNVLFPSAGWGKNNEWPCLAVQHVPGQPIAARSADIWVDELAMWHSTAACIAMAEWIWEIDGNAGNLISTGRGEFIAIDFADSFGGEYWTPKLLRKNVHTPFYNKRLHIAWGGVATTSQRHAIQQAAAGHADILRTAWPEIARWWAAMLKTEKQCRAAFEFLHARAAPDWITTRL